MTPKAALTPIQLLVIVKRLKIIIIIIGTLLAISLYILYLKERMRFAVSFKSSFTQPVPHKTAAEAIDNYRSIPSFPVFTKRSHGVVYAKEDIITYLNTTFVKITNDLPGNDSCKWVVGFYYMKKFDAAGKRKMDFLVIPTLYDTSTLHYGNVYDYFDPANKRMYKHKTPSTPTAQDDPADFDAYDAGELWP